MSYEIFALSVFALRSSLCVLPLTNVLSDQVVVVKGNFDML